MILNHMQKDPDRDAGDPNEGEDSDGEDPRATSA
jgi:hypothetical protein